MSKSAHELTRKEMKAPDQFQVVAGQAAGWMAKHQKRIVAVVAALVGVMLVMGVVQVFQNKQEEKAATALYKVLEAMGGQIASADPTPGMQGPFYKDEQEQQKAILSAADAVTKDFPGSRAARMARLAAASAHLRLGENDAALEAYQGVVASFRPGDGLQFAALEGLAYTQEAKGDLKGAVATMDRLSKDSPEFKDRAMFEKARLLAKDGQPDEARKILTAFPTDFPTSTLLSDAKAQLERLGAKK
jgi:tetratricopeptide (TPR) repeat protein